MVSNEELSALEPHLRELARQLVSNPDQADDVIQETFVDALRRTPDRDRNANGWLRRLLRIHAQKADQRERERRTIECALPESLCDPGSESTEHRKRTFLRQLAVELRTLRDPYRSALTARFLEGRMPLDLARREGVSVRTINTRIARGLALLRDRVVRRKGGPTWGLAGLLGLRRLRVAFGVLVLAGVGASVLAVRSGTSSAEVSGIESASADAVQQPAVERTGPLQRTERPVHSRSVAALDTASRTASAQPLGGEAARVLQGRVVDLAGRPVPSVEVVLESGQTRTAPDNGVDIEFVADGAERVSSRTHRDGSYQLELPVLDAGRLTVRDPQYVTVLAGLLLGDVEPHVLVVDRRAALAGRIVAEDGVGLEGALVRVRPPDRSLSGLGGLRRALPQVRQATTVAGGTFHVEEAFDARDARIEVSAPGFQTRIVSREAAASSDIVLTPLPGAIRGQLSFEDGRPVRGGQIVCHGRTVTTGPGGGFLISVPIESDQEGSRAHLIGIAPGHLPARASLAGRRPGERVELVVGAPALSIEGRVITPGGEHVVDASVSLIDPTPIDIAQDRASIEALLCAGGARGGAVEVRTDAEGRFRLPCLLDRDYRLRVLARDGVGVLDTPSIAAGTSALVLEVEPVLERSPVMGLVLDIRGQPIAGAKVSAHRALHADRTMTPAVSARGPSTTTDEDGWFLLPGVPDDGGCELHVWAEGFFGRRIPLQGQNRDAMEVVAVPRASLEVVWAGGAPGQMAAVSLLSESGKALTLLPASELDRKHPTPARESMQIAAGVPGFAVVPGMASTVVLAVDGREVARAPITWTPQWSSRIEL